MELLMLNTYYIYLCHFVVGQDTVTEHGPVLTMLFEPCQQGMFTLELSFIVLEIPSDAYTTLSRNLNGCSTLSQEYCKLIS